MTDTFFSDGLPLRDKILAPFWLAFLFLPIEISTEINPLCDCLPFFTCIFNQNQKYMQIMQIIGIKILFEDQVHNLRMRKLKIIPKQRSLTSALYFLR